MIRSVFFFISFGGFYPYLSRTFKHNTVKNLGDRKWLRTDFGVVVHLNIDVRNKNGFLKKSRIRETKHLSTDVDSSTNAIGGWKKSSKMQKLKNV